MLKVVHDEAEPNEASGSVLDEIVREAARRRSVPARYSRTASSSNDPTNQRVVISKSRDTPIHHPDVAEAARPGLWSRVLGAVGLGGAAGAAGTAALADKSHPDPEQPSDEAGEAPV
jgi:hypothetical protein